MPFGLKNAPGTSQRVIDVIFSTVKWQTALVYLDDIVIYSNTIKAYIGRVQQVLQLLPNAGVTLKMNKCNFLTATIDYLGHVIRPERLEIASHTTAAIKGLQPPTNDTELWCFLGLCNVFR